MKLADLDVMVVDCQAAGATPAHGDLLELGWGVCTPRGLERGARAHWIKPETDRPIPRAVRQLTGWDESCLPAALEASDAWLRLREDAPCAPCPTVIHWARFELPFLRALQARAKGELPLDVVCLHAIAERLLPELPRRNIRALAGHLGFSVDLARRAAGHVEASAHIWRALVPRLAALGVERWDDVHRFVAAPRPARPQKRIFSFSAERRRALPAGPGVYRFVRSNGDVLYVGKAVDLRRRVTSHFRAKASVSERNLEMLTQAHDVVVTQTETALEAALLECDEIRRLDPPYNVQLKSGDARAWFATRDLDDPIERPDRDHPIGPLPSARSLVGIAAIRRLALGAEPTPDLCARALGVPLAFAPDVALFAKVFAAFDRGPDVLAAARAAWPDRDLDGDAEREEDEAEEAAEEWTEPGVLRALSRSLVGGGLLVRRARWLCALAAARVTYREARAPDARLLELDGPRALRDRQRAFTRATYDRLRVLSTELRRVLAEGGDVDVTLFGRRIDARSIYEAL